MKTPHVLAILALSVVPAVGHSQVKVTVVPVESADDFRAWLGKPVNAARAANPSSYPGTLRTLPTDRKTQLPILVTGLPTPAPQAMQLVADMEVFGTDGKSLGTAPRCCDATIARGSSEGAVLMTSTVIFDPETDRRRGTYTVRASVTDGTQAWTTSQTFPYGEGDMPGSHEIPRLKMNVPPAAAESGGPNDKRNCLGLPTLAEVIRCSEKKK